MKTTLPPYVLRMTVVVPDGVDPSVVKEKGLRAANRAIKWAIWRRVVSSRFRNLGNAAQ